VQQGFFESEGDELHS